MFQLHDICTSAEYRPSVLRKLLSLNYSSSLSDRDVLQFGLKPQTMAVGELIGLSQLKNGIVTFFCQLLQLSHMHVLYCIILL